MTDVTGWKLRGPVHTLRREHAEWDGSRQAWKAPRGGSTVTFRHDGQAAEEASHNPDGAIARSARLYDDAGRIIEVQSWMNEGSRSRVLYSYDPLGRLAEAVGVAPDGTRRAAETCRYGDN